MKIRVTDNRLGKPIELGSLGSVVVYDDYGAPILVLQNLADGVIVAYKATDAEFGEAMRALGIGLNRDTKYKALNHGTIGQATARS
jgi:hypothetical protein